MEKGGRKTVLYADILFIVNFCMDVVSLSLMLKLSSLKCGIGRLAAAGCIGSLFSLFDTVISPPFAVSVAASVIISFVMVVICAGKRCGISFYIKYTAVLWACAALLAGGATLICSFGDFSSTPVNSKEKSAVFVLVLAVMLVVFAVRAFVSSPKCEFVEVTFCVGDYRRKVSAMVDTGNMACDPISGCPVVFLKYDEKLDGKFSGLLCGVDGVSLLERDVKKRIRAVPVRRAGESRVLCGVSCEVLYFEKATDAVLVFEAVKGYGGAEALVPPSVV